MDSVRSFDRHILQEFDRFSNEDIFGRPFQRGLLSALLPFAAFSAFSETGDIVTGLMSDATSHASTRINSLLELLLSVESKLSSIQWALEEVRKEAAGAIGGDREARDALRALWTHLAQLSDRIYLIRKPHATQLRQLTDVYQTAREMTGRALAVLRHADHEVREFNYAYRYADPIVLLQEHPIMTIADKVRHIMEKLEQGRKDLDRGG